MNSTILEYLLTYAQEKHIFQKRKNGEEYFNHILDVFEIINDILNKYSKDLKFDEPTILDIKCASILHDTIEDTQTNYDEIVHITNDRVALWVSKLSEDNRLPREQKHFLYWQTLSSSCIQIKLIKLADIYSNLKGIRGNEDLLWIRYSPSRVVLNDYRAHPGLLSRWKLKVMRDWSSCL